MRLRYDHHPAPLAPVPRNPQAIFQPRPQQRDRWSQAIEVSRRLAQGRGFHDFAKAGKLADRPANLYPQDLHLLKPARTTIETFSNLGGNRIAQADLGTQIDVLSLLEDRGNTRDDSGEAKLNDA